MASLHLVWIPESAHIIISQVAHLQSLSIVTDLPVMGPGLVSTSPAKSTNRCSRRKTAMTLPVMHKDSR